MMARLVTLIMIILTSSSWRVLAQRNVADHIPAATSERDDMIPAENHFGSCVCRQTCPSTPDLATNNDDMIQAENHFGSCVCQQTCSPPPESDCTCAEVASAAQNAILQDVLGKVEEIKSRVLLTPTRTDGTCVEVASAVQNAILQDALDKIEEMKLVMAAIKSRVFLLPPATDKDNTPWEYHAGHFYLVKFIRKNVHDAKTYCNLYGANLVSINSRREQAFLESIFRRERGNSDVHVFIGGEYVQRNNKWIWADGTDVTWTNWNTGEPNNEGGIEKYIEIRTSNYVWNDVGGNLYAGYVNAGFVCERPSIM